MSSPVRERIIPEKSEEDSYEKKMLYYDEKRELLSNLARVIEFIILETEFGGRRNFVVISSKSSNEKNFH